MNYLVVLFKNKERKKIINKFLTLEKAKQFYDKKITENDKIYFDKKIENATPCNFELCILEKKNDNFDLLYVRDDLGRQVKVTLDDPIYKIIKISNYKIEEKLYDITDNKKITLSQFYKKYILKKGIILISRLNNKIVLQEEEKIFLFSLKDENESFRFLNVLSELMINNSIKNCIIVSETSKQQKKYLYSLLEDAGIDKKILYRNSTTFKHRK